LHAAVPPATYAMWFADLQPVALEGDPPTLELSAPSQYVARTLTGRYFGVLQEAARGPLGPGAALAVRIASIDPDGAGDDHGTSASDAGTPGGGATSAGAPPADSSSSDQGAGRGSPAGRSRRRASVPHQGPGPDQASLEDADAGPSGFPARYTFDDF